MKKAMSFLATGILACLLITAFSYQAVVITGDKQRCLDIGYLDGYQDGRDTMKKEFEDQLKVVKHARQLTKAGYEIDN